MRPVCSPGSPSLGSDESQRWSVWPFGAQSLRRRTPAGVPSSNTTVGLLNRHWGFRAGMVTGIGICLLVVLVGWASGAMYSATHDSVSYRAGDIVSLTIQPTEGPSLRFVRNPPPHGSQPLGLVIHMVPNPLPRPLDQGLHCQGGGSLIIELRSGHAITYGPCKWPWQISELWGAMIEASALHHRLRRANP
jgi:hypothetical protein